MRNTESKYYFFLGIGGIGMSALAKYISTKGIKVIGYDKTRTTITNDLEKQGVFIFYEDSEKVLPSDLNAENTSVIFTPAIPKDSRLLIFFQQNNYILKKRSELLGEISANSINLSVAGTHGKTTTSAILTHILYDNGVPMSAFLGGILNDYNTNFISSGEKYSVTEADEFDRSFLRLKPTFACITSTDADHLDIYGDKDEVKLGFNQFAALVSGKLFVQEETGVDGISYGFSSKADCSIKNVRIENAKFVFDLEYKGKEMLGYKQSLAGRHNVLNATAAILLSLELGISVENIRKSLATFSGVKRRFSVHELSNGKFYIDDYAHHPTELNACIDAARELFPEKRILGIFQPHLFSRTRDFADDFAESLSKLDELILLDIYPAREKPIKGIDSEWLLGKVKLEKKSLANSANALRKIDFDSFDVIMTMGAGDIDLLVEQIKNIEP